MFDLWKEDLSEEKTEELLDKVADQIRKRKLEAPAILFFEMHKPLANIASHAGLAASPMLVPFLGFDNVNDYTRLFSDRKNVEKLLLKLEEARSARAEVT